MPDAPLLAAAAVTRRYTLPAEVVTALADVTLAVDEGEFVAVLGPSGSGKTTLLNLLSGLDRPSAGAVRLRGHDLGGLSERRLAALRCREIGFVFQDAFLMSGLDALGNVVLPRLLAGLGPGLAQARELLDRLGVLALARRLPAQLSRGEKQRVALARALANRPACLFADEPTSNLDPTAKAALLETLAELNRRDGLTVVVATHDDAVARIAGRRIVLAAGRLAQDDLRPGAARDGGGT